jgi:hypothetical protein
MLDYDTIKLLPGEPGHFTRLGGTTTALRSQQDVARMLGISKQRVHQLERSAILKLRVALQPLIDERWRTNGK